MASTQSRTGRCDGTRTTGTENSEPVLARTDLGSYTSAAWPVTMIPDAPKASADRISVPMFPGLVGRSKTTVGTAGPGGVPPGGRPAAAAAARGPGGAPL